MALPQSQISLTFWALDVKDRAGRYRLQTNIEIFRQASGYHPITDDIRFFQNRELHDDSFMREPVEVESPSEFPDSRPSRSDLLHPTDLQAEDRRTLRTWSW